MIRRLFISAVCAATPLFALGQAWPNKPVTIVVPFPPGGSADPIARVIAAKLQTSLGQAIIVDNRAGASGVVGTNYVAKSKPDGYTFLLAFDTHAENPALVERMPYDTLKDFSPITLIGKAPMVIAAPANQSKTWAEAVAAAKAKPGTMSVGHVLNGSLGHLALTLVQQDAGIDVVKVAYKGAAAMVNDLLGGHINLGIGTVTSMAEQVRSKRLVGLATTGDKRAPILPDVPTLNELGLKGFSVYAWWAMFAPAGTPKDIQVKFQEAVDAALTDPTVARQLSDQLGVQVTATGPQDLQKFLESEMTRWRKVIVDNNIKAD